MTGHQTSKSNKTKKQNKTKRKTKRDVDSRDVDLVTTGYFEDDTTSTKYKTRQVMFGELYITYTDTLSYIVK